ncbi:hypothetical protein ADIARSV_3907 [Arcticibacter svalbardensis MN12-7]|uniref:Uncharacterized protein n=1 Tax=Arcticibacter svalbardensis MN12-7 TaxID=1150600 RepID=R9GMM1_9SPHI|nr:hypothetical protein [Arcticibacter svalbardensis]EOR92956.1 hypothetical protein ADIARSV_3907 [Arcticibacter svalbardensis MN12-7]
MSSKNKKNEEKSYREGQIKTEGPLAEKDEVKQAEERLRENTKKSINSEIPSKGPEKE